MFGHFYNQGMRKMTVAFGQVFNNIQIKRQGSDSTVQSIRVPLAYAPKEKFLVRLDEQSNLENRQFATTLPRLGFEITGLSFDPSRKLNKMNKTIKVKETTDGKVNFFNYTPVPYNINFSLYSFTATAENGLMIIEQILPWFQPEYTVTMKAVPEMDIVRDVPIILNSVNYEDSYNGEFTQRRAVIYTLNFTAKTYLYGPMNNSKVIKKVQDDLYTDTDTTSKREERIVVTPNPTTADADDDFGFTTTISTFTDAKEYNPVTDKDE